MLTSDQLPSGPGLRPTDVISGRDRPETTALSPGCQRAKSKKPLLVLALAILALGLLWGLRGRGTTTSPSPAGAGRLGAVVVPVVPGTVTLQEMPIYLDGLGTVQAFYTATVRAQVDGLLLEVAFTEGQEVHQGDLLARIDPTPFQAQLDQSLAKKAQDEAQLGIARITLKRDEELLAQKILAQQDYDTQRFLVAQLEAAIKADEAAIANARVQLGYTRIVAPIDGRTGLRLVDPGNIVRANDTNGVVLITQLHPICVVFTLPEQRLGEVQTGLSSSEPLAVIALGRDNRTVLSEGKLAVLDNQIDTSTGTFRLKATFSNDDQRLWPGQFVNARLLLTRRKGPVVLAQAIQRGPEGAYVFLIRSDSTVEARPVKVDRIEQGLALIAEGLQVGEPVVIDGQYKLQNGSKVRTTNEAPSGQARDRRGGKAPKAKPVP